MRISDWRADVCSSDLDGRHGRGDEPHCHGELRGPDAGLPGCYSGIDPDRWNRRDCQRFPACRMAGFPDWPDDDEPRSTSAALARCWSFSLFSHWFGAATPHGAVLRSELVGRIGAALGCDLRLGHCADPVGMWLSAGWIYVCGPCDRGLALATP